MSRKVNLSEDSYGAKLELLDPQGARCATLASNEHGWFIAPPNDEYIGRTLLLGGTWDEKVLSAVLPRIPLGGTVVDAGAHVGAHTVPYARAVGAEGTVMSFEPQRVLFQQLCANVALNGLNQVFTYQLGLGHADGLTAQLDARVPQGRSAGDEVDYNTTQAMNYGAVRLGDDGEYIELCTLDSFELQRLDLLKVDVEGAEPLLFFGAQQTLRRCRPIILFESIDNPLAESVQAQLQIPPEAVGFDVERFCLEDLGYAELETVDHFNRMLIPPTD